MTSGLIDIVVKQLHYTNENNQLSLDKFLLGLCPLLFVVIFLYQRSKFGFGLATFYLVMRLMGALTTLYLYGSQLDLNTVFYAYPVNLESMAAVIVGVISGYAIFICSNYWRELKTVGVGDTKPPAT